MGEAEKYLIAKHKHFAKVIPNHEPFPIAAKGSKDPYRSLMRAIVFQQLSGKAATTIFNRVLALFPAPFPEPHMVLDIEDEKLRGAGLSRQKIAAIRDLAAKRIEGVVPHARAMTHLPDEEIIERLVSVRGVGRWTVEMYLIFTLCRPDVLPVDDLGVRKGAEKLYKRTFTPKELAAFGERWAPHRTAAAWHFWRVMDTKTPG
jgi:DNA-3-methyladenine glycosylase II